MRSTMWLASSRLAENYVNKASFATMVAVATNKHFSHEAARATHVHCVLSAAVSGHGGADCFPVGGGLPGKAAPGRGERQQCGGSAGSPAGGHLASQPGHPGRTGAYYQPGHHVIGSAQ
ncbi:hypothetical protein VI06_15495 [Aquitalea magnusonii]|nr:hypothetical protein VI06_15495 [Aquitalea magnusonii]